MKRLEVPNKVFREIQRAAIRVWTDYNNEYNYVNEKVERILNIENVHDNAGCIISMFDLSNQVKFITLVNEETHNYIEKNLSNWCQTLLFKKEIFE